MLDRAMELPTWLYDMSYGLSHYEKLRVLIDGRRFAVVQQPGYKWFDNSGGHAGLSTYFLVDKRRPVRKGYGLINHRTLQHGGRAKLTQWKHDIELVEAVEAM
jgi:hypothetical protein